MNESKKYKVECQCGKKFDIQVEIQKIGKESSIEFYCPFCDNLMTTTLPDEPAETASVLRGAKKVTPEK